ncbi:MAG: hypothetical protein KF888_00640 [Nitrosomonas sp.]|nr:hypothetical protein [Nitrosomonas sp.]
MTASVIRPGRFEYVHIPSHGSWLNLIECTFSRMVHTFFRHIQDSSKEELKERILEGVADFNEIPIPLCCESFDLGVVKSLIVLTK